MDTLLQACQTGQVRFVTWFTVADFDALWSGALAMDPLAQLWRDTGLYDGVQVARPGLEVWQRWLAHPEMAPLMERCREHAERYAAIPLAPRVAALLSRGE